MKKQDIFIVFILLLLMIAWPFIYNIFFPAPTIVPADDEAALSSLSAEDALDLPVAESPVAAAEKNAASSDKEVTKSAPPTGEVIPVKPDEPERRLALSNADTTLVLSSHGARIVSVELPQYRQAVSADSSPVLLDFADFPALSYVGLPEITADSDFEICENPDSTMVSFKKTTSSGLVLTRTFELQKNYNLEIKDTFENTASEPLALPEHEIQLGYMSGTQDSEQPTEPLGVDVLRSEGGEGVVYLGKKMAKMFQPAAKNAVLPQEVNEYRPNPVDWLAVKNKFFVQILTPSSENTPSAYRVLAKRYVVPGEDRNPRLSPRKPGINSVSGSLIFSPVSIPPGGVMQHKMSYYAGPKKFSILREIKLKQQEVMEFGMWSPVCKFLLTVLNATYRYIPNYGIAIILLTILIRVLFWPLTHKSTESMRKMQKLQPLMNELRTKYKDNPKKMQAETMELYRKHKVNPMGGCLPMLVQIPVFIALFVVLRSAIELRFAEFLWVKDLSEPERLFTDYLPISLNILPLIMAATMFWQQKLMPASGDASQQKMMAIFMPLMMLFMLYNMPSALVLYWTTNQCLMIIQQLVQKKRIAMDPSPA